MTAHRNDILFHSPMKTTISSSSPTKSDTVIPFISNLMTRNLYLNDRILKVNRIIFHDDNGNFDISIEDGRLVYNTEDNITNPEELILEYMKYETIPALVEIEYVLYSGPFDYAELDRQYSDANVFLIHDSNGGMVEFSGRLSDDDNEYLAQFGLYDSNKPIPKSYESDAGNFLLEVVYYNDILETMGG